MEYFSSINFELFLLFPSHDDHILLSFRLVKNDYLQKSRDCVGFVKYHTHHLIHAAICIEERTAARSLMPASKTIAVFKVTVTAGGQTRLVESFYRYVCNLFSVI